MQFNHDEFYLNNYVYFDLNTVGFVGYENSGSVRDTVYQIPYSHVSLVTRNRIYPQKLY